LIARHLLRKCLLDDLFELMMVSSEQEYLFQPKLKLILLDVLHHCLAVLVKSLSVLVDHAFEVFDTCLERREDTLDVSFEILELLVFDVHNRGCGKVF